MLVNTTVCPPETTYEANLGRTWFSPSEIFLNKAPRHSLTEQLTESQFVVIVGK